MNDWLDREARRSAKRERDAEAYVAGLLDKIDDMTAQRDSLRADVVVLRADVEGHDNTIERQRQVIKDLRDHRDSLLDLRDAQREEAKKLRKDAEHWLGQASDYQARYRQLSHRMKEVHAALGGKPDEHPVTVAQEVANALRAWAATFGTGDTDGEYRAHKRLLTLANRIPFAGILAGVERV